MPLFRRKPFTIQARRVREEDGEIVVESPYRVCTAKPGDWIVGDDKQQSVAHDILFRALYEPVDDAAKRELEG